jgi:Subtilase family
VARRTYAPPPLRDLERLDGPVAARLVRRGIAAGARPDGWPVLLRPDSVLAKAPDDDEVERIVPEAERVGLSVEGSRPADVRRIGAYVRLDFPPEEPGPGGGWSVGRVSRSLADLGALGVKAKPNHLYLGYDHPLQALWSPAGVARRGRAGLRTTARPTAPMTLPDPLDLPGRERPRVLVLDTGLMTVEVDGTLVAEHASLRGHVRLHEPWRSSPGVCTIDDDDEQHGDRDPDLDVCAGHGTFIAGIVRALCPDAEVHVDGVLSSFGDGDDDSIEAGMRRAVTRTRPDDFDVVVMSLRAYTTDDRFPPLAAAIQDVASNGRTLVVAAAGNDATARPAYPAAMPDVVGVGALDMGRRAWFSNFGGWVDACAPGVDVVSTFFCDAVDGRGSSALRFEGWAVWSGTSFAAPKVAASIAQDMYMNGGTSKDAWRRLSGSGRGRHPDLGVLFDVT